MTNYNNNYQLPAPELLETMTGSRILIGTLIAPPVKIIFDNMGTVPVEIGTDAVTTWKTFPAGEALVLDNALEAFPEGTRFYGDGASGDFSIAYTYVKQS